MTQEFNADVARKKMLEQLVIIEHLGKIKVWCKRQIPGIYCQPAGCLCLFYIPLSLCLRVLSSRSIRRADIYFFHLYALLSGGLSPPYT